MSNIRFWGFGGSSKNKEEKSKESQLQLKIDRLSSLVREKQKIINNLKSTCHKKATFEQCESYLTQIQKEVVRKDKLYKEMELKYDNMKQLLQQSDDDIKNQTNKLNEVNNLIQNNTTNTELKQCQQKYVALQSELTRTKSLLQGSQKQTEDVQANLNNSINQSVIKDDSIQKFSRLKMIYESEKKSWDEYYKNMQKFLNKSSIERSHNVINLPGNIREAC